MTTRELRQQLFEVSDQDMTVSELRAILFEMEQDVHLNQQTCREMNLLWKKQKEDRDLRAEHYKFFKEGNLP